MDRFQLIHLIYLLGFAILVLPAVLATHRSGRTWLRNALGWLAVAGVLVLAYMIFR